MNGVSHWTPERSAGSVHGMNFLLPQSRIALVQAVRPFDLHGDRYLDLLLEFDGEAEPRAVRLHASECPAGLAAGERLSVRLVMGVATGVTREAG